MKFKNPVLLSCLLGNFIAWYDFALFALATAIIFKDFFFSEMSYLMPAMAFAVGMLARPVGSVLYGHLGDRIGRKHALMSTLLLTGISTVLIGLLPSYAAIGIAAPILLITLRILQTIAVGGEWAAVSTNIYEHNLESKNKGLLGSMLSSGWALGSLVAALMFGGVSMLTGDQFSEWGWRIPFLLSGVLVVIGLYVRRQMIESEEFQNLKDQNQLAIWPVLEVFKSNYKKMLALILVHQHTSGWLYGLMVFGMSYLTTVGISKAYISQTWMYMWPIIFACCLFFGWAGDKFGRQRVLTVGTILGFILAYPVYSWLASGMMVLPIVVGVGILMGIGWANAPTYFTENFDPAVRQSGSGVSLSLGALMGGGIMPIFATWLNQNYGIMSIAYLYMGLAVLAFLALQYLKQKYEQPR
jgi:MFS family permease